MNDLLNKLLELDRFILDKLSSIRNPKYLEAIAEARKKINEAGTIIALANK